MAEGSISIQNAWNAVTLEERLELVSRCKAVGIISGVGFILLTGSISYGFDQIWLLPAALAGAFLVGPLFSSYKWRNGKPELILNYLAARSVARRYALGLNFSDIDIVLIFKAEIRQIFASEEEKQIYMQNRSEANKVDEWNPVWICLMRGGTIALREDRGGAKLQFFTPITAETSSKIEELDASHAKMVLIEGSGVSKGVNIQMRSQHPGALYVFEKRLHALIEEQLEAVRYLENLRTQNL